MKIKQEQPVFQPITITLETPNDVYLLWDFIEGRKINHEQKQKLTDLCNWFSNKAQI